jgi:hypothetical protein
LASPEKDPWALPSDRVLQRALNALGLAESDGDDGNKMAADLAASEEKIQGHLCALDEDLNAAKMARKLAYAMRRVAMLNERVTAMQVQLVVIEKEAQEAKEGASTARDRVSGITFAKFNADAEASANTIFEHLKRWLERHAKAAELEREKRAENEERERRQAESKRLELEEKKRLRCKAEAEERQRKEEERVEGAKVCFARDSVVH